VYSPDEGLHSLTAGRSLVGPFGMWRNNSAHSPMDWFTVELIL